jgi:hypothetical protein
VANFAASALIQFWNEAPRMSEQLQMTAGHCLRADAFNIRHEGHLLTDVVDKGVEMPAER